MRRKHVTIFPFSQKHSFCDRVLNLISFHGMLVSKGDDELRIYVEKTDYVAVKVLQKQVR
jgi:ATP adenylyltransferase/5',5'''-P-1,P-4-tetraphosphate phosphorylase II